MKISIEDKRVQIFYEPIYKEYFIPLLEEGKVTVIQCLNFCPWCATKLPENLTDKWFEILEKEYGLDDPDGKDQQKLVPEEFKTDEWWKKRDL